ncbi:LuxR family transcriptional regulator [Leucobacter triazinivorans]|uniref:LuxR family transcriptional regulator n=1 Tax=Leucobacter triazinivorans TaxID=1784719 RepID=A0A4P6KEG6_9MICO|nr:LuxR family transcriptional regulator [Leucobacter triazinivorans]QBE48652.1 LuxR family transcriptional regulator [Leucobacter triazinivorans]
METFTLQLEECGTTTASPAAVASAVTESSTPERLEAVVETLIAPGSVSLLIGGAGTGKNRLVQEAATALSERLGERVAMISLIPPTDPMTGIAGHLGRRFPAAPPDSGSRISAAEADPIGARLMEAVDREAQRGAPLIVAQGLDQYSTEATLMLDRLVRSRRSRVVGTARRLSGAAAHVARDPRVHTITVPPLTVEECRRFVERLLGVELVELETLRRWYRLTEGNSLSLTLLVLALDRQGLIGRHRGVAYELPGAVAVPSEFGDFLRETCSPEELRTLELVANVEPMFESTFVELLDPEHVAGLQERGILALGSTPNGNFTLSLRHQMLAAAVREQMSPSRVVEVSEQLFSALQQELGDGGPYRAPSLLLRAVEMGLDAHRNLPLSWLSEALEGLSDGADPGRRLRIALALAAHPDASTSQLASAALQAVRIARMMGDRARLDEGLEHVREAVGRLRRSAASPATERVRLQLALVEHCVMDREDPSEAASVLDELEREFADSDGPIREAILSARVQLLASTGQLRQALERAPQVDEIGSMPVEWERTRARAVSALILSQQGRSEAAIRLADHSAAIAAIGEQQLDNAKLLRFCSFIGSWSCGSIEEARHTLGEFAAESFADVHFSGLVETCSVLIALADGKWRLAAQRAERLKARLAESDRYGLTGLANAALALALAALGEKEASRRAIRQAETRQLGLSQMVAGYARLMTLRARQWNADVGTAALGLRLAAWARAEQLDGIELQALHLLAVESPDEATIYRARIQTLAGSVQLPMSAVLLAHCEELFDGHSAWDTPPARTLTEFGLWVPLPLTEALSAREREIAMFAALGYSSRWIAEQFHLSVRTVDTHLRHVFTKLHVGGRDELRQWFRREHSLG